MMTGSVLRNPDALLLFTQLKDKGDYTVAHALDVAVYMIAFGRFLQLETVQIEFLGYLGLLQDIGKVRLPRDLLEKRDRLSVEEFERHDGSGYPRGLRGPEIGMIGSIAAIVDTFDALTVKRPYAGEIGVVIAQNLAKRLQPRVMVIRDAAGNALRPQKLLDLAREPKIAAGEPYRIRRTLEYGTVPVSSEDLFMR